MATDVRVSVWTASPSILIHTVRGKAHPHIARTGESPVRAVDDEPHVAAEELVVLGRQPVDPSGARVDVEPDRVDVVSDDEDAVQPAVERARRERRRAARPGEGRAHQQLRVRSRCSRRTAAQRSELIAAVAGEPPLASTPAGSRAAR